MRLTLQAGRACTPARAVKPPGVRVVLTIVYIEYIVYIVLTSMRSRAMHACAPIGDITHLCVCQTTIMFYHAQERAYVGDDTHQQAGPIDLAT